MTEKLNIKEYHQHKATGLLTEINNISPNTVNSAEVMITLSAISIIHVLLALYWQNEEKSNIEISKVRHNAEMET